MGKGLNLLAAYRQEGGAVDLAEVGQHEAALQDSITLANQAASGDQFTKSQLEQASTPLQVPSAVCTPYLGAGRLCSILLFADISHTAPVNSQLPCTPHTIILIM